MPSQGLLACNECTSSFIVRPYDLLAQATLPQKRKKNRELLPNVERRASKQHVLRVNRYLGMLNSGLGLRQFQNIAKLHKWNLAVGCQTGKFPVPMPHMDKDYEPDSMSICSDQEQTQITGGEFMFKPEPAGLGCTGARLIDDFHRWNNDVASAVAKSGLAPCEKAATLWLNIGYGPWQSGAWFHAIITEGVRLPKSIKKNSRLLMRFWKRVLQDRKVGRSGSDHQRGEAARAEFLKNLPSMDLLKLRGIKVAPAQWMSVYAAGHAWDESLAARALVLSSLCMKKGWILTEEDLFSCTRLGATSGGAKPDPKSKAAGVRDAKQKLRALQDRQQNNMVAATKLMADIDVVNGFRVMMLAGRSQWTGFNTLVNELTTPEKCLACAISWANWGWLDSLRDCQSCLADAVGLSRCGIETDFTTAEVRGMNMQSVEAGTIILAEIYTQCQ